MIVDYLGSFSDHKSIKNKSKIGKDWEKKDLFEGTSNEIKIDLNKKLLYLSGTSNILIDGKDITGEEIIFDYSNNSILNSENLRIKSGNS